VEGQKTEELTEVNDVYNRGVGVIGQRAKTKGNMQASDPGQAADQIDDEFNARGINRGVGLAQ
jgi:hypothetical protein